MQKFSRAFTLIEILVVIAIIGIVSSVLLANLKGAREKAYLAAAKGNLASLRSEMANIATRGRYPESFCPGGNTEIKDVLTTGELPSKAVVAMAKGVADSLYTLKCAISDPTAGSVAYWSAWFDQSPNDPTVNGPYFCVDSNGFSGNRTTEPSSEVCPAS
jgi:prepilin-type N-terminal cleavage/methylation domain-containing protein